MKIHIKIKNIIVGGLLLSLLSGCGTATPAENVVGNTNLNLFNMGIAAEQGNKIYYADRGTLYSADLDGENSKELTKCEVFSPHINVVGDWIYFFNHEGTYEENNVRQGIYKIRTNGKDLQRILDIDVWGVALIVRDGMMYYFDGDDLCKAGVNGEDKKVLLTTPRHFIDTDERRIYLSEDGQKICFNCSLDDHMTDFYVMDLNGENIQSITELIPNYNWNYRKTVAIQDDLFMNGDSCVDRNGNIVYGLSHKSTLDHNFFFNYYKDYVIHIDRNEWGNDAVFLYDTETGEEVEVLDIVQECGVDEASREIGCAGNCAFFYAEKLLPVEYIDGTEIQPVKSELVILGENDFEEAIKELQQKAEILEKGK